MSVAVESAVAPVEEADICCICCDVETPEAAFISPGPCKCKGSIKYHLPCLLQAMQHSPTCGACKTPFTDPEFIGMLKRELKPEEEVLMNTSHRYEHTKNAIIYYKVDEAGVEQGEAYVFVEYTMYWVHTGFYYFATVNFTDGVICGEVAVASDHAKSHRNSLHKDMTFTVTGGEVCGEFIRYFPNNYYYHIPGTPQLVQERGCWLPGQKLIGLHELRAWVSVGGEQKFTAIERATYKEDGSGQLEDGEHMHRCPRDPNYVVFAHHKNGVLHGDWARYKNRAEGSPCEERRQYKNGVLHGVRTHYDTLTGEPLLKQYTEYKDGLRHGKTYLYVVQREAAGVNNILPVAEGNFKNGVQVGIQRAYQNGRLYEETTLAADGSGLLDGICTYYADGALYQRASFKMGVLDGFLRFYDKRSVERVRILMKDGRPKEGSRATYFDMSGSVEEERKVEYGAFLADFLEEGAIVRQNATLMGDRLGTSVDVELYEPEQEPEQDDSCYCSMCYRSSHDYYDSDDDYDRDNYYERRYRRGYYD